MGHQRKYECKVKKRPCRPLVLVHRQKQLLLVNKSANKLCLLTKFVFDGVQLLFVNTDNTKGSQTLK
jgi:hypothetical protein